MSQAEHSYPLNVMADMNTVIFAGSGFSKAVFNQKIQSELLNDFLTGPESEMYLRHLPKDLIQQMKHTNDIELVMSDYFNMGYSGFPCSAGLSKSHQRAILFFRMALAIYFRDSFERIGREYYEGESKHLLRYYFEDTIDSADSVTLVTTNYDLGLEHVANDIFDGGYYYPGIDGESDASTGVPILKLHGSINWMEDRGPVECPVFVNITRKACRTDIIGELSLQELADGFTLQLDGTKYAPIMFPFFYQKEQWSEVNFRWWGKTFDTIWKTLHESLRNADHILFWGYSLPAADHHMYSFLKSILPTTKANCVIVDFLSDRNRSHLMELAEIVYSSRMQQLQIYNNGLISYVLEQIGT